MVRLASTEGNKSGGRTNGWWKWWPSHSRELNFRCWEGESAFLVRQNNAFRQGLPLTLTGADKLASDLMDSMVIQS